MARTASQLARNAGARQAPALETPRLRLCPLSGSDAALMLELATDPEWIRFIGDKGVHTLQDARSYLTRSLIPRYREGGYVLYRLDLKESGLPVGICGLLQRDDLEDADVGFALLARHRGHGYAREAAAAVTHHGHRVLGLPRIAALTVPANHASIRVLESIGFCFQRCVVLEGAREVMALYVREEKG